MSPLGGGQPKVPRPPRVREPYSPPALRTDAELYREAFERTYGDADKATVLERGMRCTHPPREQVEAALIAGHRDLYVRGYIDVGEFERRVEAVLTMPSDDPSLAPMGLGTAPELR